MSAVDANLNESRSKRTLLKKFKTGDVFSGNSVSVKLSQLRQQRPMNVVDKTASEDMEVDKVYNTAGEEDLHEDDETSQDSDDEDQRHVLDLDQKRYLVLLIVCIATAISELGFLTIVNLRRVNLDSRNKGAFYYVFFRQIHMLMFALLYIPSAYIIEIVGVSKSVTLGMLICTISMWTMFLNYLTLAMFIISVSLPFIVNATTTISARWFGPKGRNIATGMILLCISIPVGVEVLMGEGFEKNLNLILPILSTVWTIVCFSLIYDRPDFAPTISEEDKLDIRRRFPEKVTFRAQMRALLQNRSFILIALSSAFMLVDINELYSLLNIFYQSIDQDKFKLINILESLHKICQITGILTFSVALFGGLSLRFGFKILVFQFFIVYILQVLSMLFETKTYLIVTNMYEGLYGGGLIIILSELSAEIAYPVGESLSLGFINALQFMIRFIIKMIVDIETYKEDDPARDTRPDLSLGVYITLMIFFLLLTISAYVLLLKAPFYMKRSLTDACLEINEEDEDRLSTSEEGGHYGGTVKPLEEEENLLSDKLLKEMSPNKRN